MLSKKKKILTIIRASWGKELIRKRDFASISRYYHLSNRDQADIVDDVTWSDLDLDDFFAKIDRCITPVGSQYLFYQLHRYEKDIDILDLKYNQYQIFLKNSDLREKIQCVLKKLDIHNAFHLPDLIFRDLPKRPKWYFLIYFLSAASLLSLISIFFYPVMFWVALLIIIINLITEHYWGTRVLGFTVDLATLSVLLKIGNQLPKLKTDINIHQIEQLKAHRKFIRILLNKIGWLTIDKSRLDELSASLIEYLNHFCLFHLIAFFRSITFIKENQIQIKSIYDSVASLDSSISVSSYLFEFEKYCKPHFNSSAQFQFNEVIHPLIDNCVPNSILLNKKSSLITGSNMAGKTTFIKTLAINTILAQTLYFVMAKNANLPQLMVRSSIKGADDINEHKSYYYKEIEAILEFLRLSTNSEKYLFVIDEIFRGTNTIERISAATSVLKYMGMKNYIFVTTHDIELQELLSGIYEMYHFSEQVSDGNHYFDYKLKPGPCTNRNAIKLLEIKGYPNEIVEAAMNLATTLSNKIYE